MSIFFEAGPREGEDLCRVRFEMITFLVSGQFIVFFPPSSSCPVFFLLSRFCEPCIPIIIFVICLNNLLYE